MLYYRLYKRMNRIFPFSSPIEASPSYTTFVLIIPIFFSWTVLKIVENFCPLSEEVNFGLVILTIFCAAVYIHFCEKHDEDP